MPTLAELKQTLTLEGRLEWYRDVLDRYAALAQTLPDSSLKNEIIDRIEGMQSLTNTRALAWMAMSVRYAPWHQCMYETVLGVQVGEAIDIDCETLTHFFDLGC